VLELKVNCYVKAFSADVERRSANTSLKMWLAQQKGGQSGALLKPAQK